MPCRWSVEDYALRTARLAAPDLYPSFAPGGPGTVYSFPVLYRLLPTETTAIFQALLLENDALELVILPEMGGRIFRARTKPEGRDLFATSPSLKPVLRPECGAWLPGGLQIDQGQSRSPHGYWPVAWRILERPGQVSVCLSGPSDDGLHHESSISLRDDSTFITMVETVHNLTSRPLPAAFWSHAAIPAEPGATILQSGEQGPEGVFWTSIYDLHEDAGVVRIAASRSDYPTSGHWISRASDGFGAPGGAVCEVESSPVDRAGGRPILAAHSMMTWTERWTPVEGTGGCLGAAGGLLFNLQPARPIGHSAGICASEGRINFEEAGDEVEDSPHRVRASIYAAEPVENAAITVLAGPEVLLQETLSLGVAEIWSAELDAPERGGDIHLSIRVDRNPSEVADTGSPGDLRARCLQAVLRLRQHPSNNELEDVRRLVQEAPLEPLVRWMERRWLAQEDEPVYQPLWNPAVEPSGERSARQEGGLSPGLNPNLCWLLEAGIALAHLGLGEAVEPLEEAARGGHALAAYHLSHWLARTGDEDGAREWIKKASAMSGAYILPYSEADLAALSAAIRLMPGDEAASYYLGIWYLFRGNLYDAESCLRKARSGEWERFDFAPVLLWSLAHCAANRTPEGQSQWDGLAAEEKSSNPSDERAALLDGPVALIDRAIGLAPRDAILYVQRDRYAAARGDSTFERAVRLRQAPAEVRSDGRVAIRLAALLVALGELDEAIRLLNLAFIHSGMGDDRDHAHQVHVEARVARALQRSAAAEYESALEDLEAALDYPAHLGAPPQPLPGRSELLWWAGVCCGRMGRGFQARGYWQAALAERQPASSLAGVCRAFAMASLGGTEQAQGLLSEAANPAGTQVTQPGIRPLREFMPAAAAAAADPEVDLATSLALYALGDRQTALRKLEWLPIRAPEFVRGPWYFDAVRAGLLDL